jgi:hypothetical protein
MSLKYFRTQRVIEKPNDSDETTLESATLHEDGQIQAVYQHYSDGSLFFESHMSNTDCGIRRYNHNHEPWLMPKLKMLWMPGVP